MERAEVAEKPAIDEGLVDDGVDIVEPRAQDGDGNRDGDEKQQAIGHGGREQDPCSRRVQQLWGEEETPNDKAQRKAAQGHNKTKYDPLRLLALPQRGDAPVAIDLQPDHAQDLHSKHQGAKPSKLNKV